MFDSRIKDRRFKPKWDTTLNKKQQSVDKTPKNNEADAKEKEKDDSK